MSIEYPCVHWNEGKCKKFSDDEVKSWCVKGPCEHQEPSNADRIRAMSDEELAEWLEWFVLSTVDASGIPHDDFEDGEQDRLLCLLKQPFDGSEWL